MSGYIPIFAEGVTDSAGNPAGTVYHSDAFAHERNTGTSNQYGVGVDECVYYSFTTNADATVTANPALVFGVLITATLTGDFAVRDGTTAAGTLILTTANNAAVGTFYELKGCKFNNGIFIDDNSSAGSAVVLYREQ